jgi:hypothetical protein
MMMLSNRSILVSMALVLAAVTRSAHAFTASSSLALRSASTAATTMPLSMSAEEFIQETPEATKERIEALIENHPVLLFMKGSKLFPQCGFSNTVRGVERK